VIPESLPWPILNTNEHQTNLRNKRSLSRRGRRNSAPPRPIYIEGKKSKLTQNPSVGTLLAYSVNCLFVFKNFYQKKQMTAKMMIFKEEIADFNF
jgi:hypothetical protein